MTEQEEAIYSRGHRAAWLQIFQDALRQLGADAPEASDKLWVAEREQAVAILRGLCDRFGDNDWSDDLHLADVIDKHLGKHLHASGG